MMIRQRVGLLVLVGGFVILAGCAGNDNAEETTPTPTITNTRGPTNTPTISPTPTEMGTATPTFTGPPPPSPTPTATPIVRVCTVVDTVPGNATAPSLLASSALGGGNVSTAITAQPFVLAMGPRNSEGKASLTLQQDAAVGVSVLAGTIPACIKFFAAGSTGQIDCNGASNYDVQSTQEAGQNTCDDTSVQCRATNNSGPMYNMPCPGGSECVGQPTTYTLSGGAASGPGAGYLSLMIQQTDPFQVMNPPTIPSDCFTLDYSQLDTDPNVFSHPFQALVTTAKTSGTKGATMLSLTGVNFDCDNFTNANGPGSLVLTLYQFITQPIMLGDSTNALRLACSNPQ